MYSAVHHEGRRLYELAREGVEVERAPRDVVVSTIDVERLEESSATLRIVCGKGTYVRVLAAELGSALGWGGAVDRLVRTRVGRFALADALAWRDLEEAPAAELWARVLPLDAALAHLPAARLDAGGARRFVHGQPADLAAPLAAGTLARVYDTAGALLGVGEAAATGRSVRPVRMVHADHPGPSVRPA
jgi:tRNA pseudouridine55 synthase